MMVVVLRFRSDFYAHPWKGALAKPHGEADHGRDRRVKAVRFKQQKPVFRKEEQIVVDPCPLNILQIIFD